MEYSATMTKRAPGPPEPVFPYCILLMVLVSLQVSKGAATEDVHSSINCKVHPLLPNQVSPKFPFDEEGRVVLGFLPDDPRNVLSGVTLRIFNSSSRAAIFAAEISSTDDNHIQCLGSNNKTALTNFDSNTHFEWQHLQVSVSNQSLSIGSEGEPVCHNEVLVNPAYLTVFVKDRGLSVVFNCQSGCPIFPENTLPTYRNEIGKHTVYGRVMSPDATFNLEIRGHPLVTIVGAQVGGNSWEVLKYKEKKEDNLHIIALSMGEFLTVLVDNTENRKLELLESRGMEWSVGCSPYSNLDGDTTAASTKNTPEAQGRTETDIEGLHKWRGLAITFLFLSLLIIAFIAATEYVVHRRWRTPRRNAEATECADFPHNGCESGEQNGMIRVGQTEGLIQPQFLLPTRR